MCSTLFVFVKCEEEAMLSAVTVNEKYLAKLVSLHKTLPVINPRSLV